MSVTAWSTALDPTADVNPPKESPLNLPLPLDRPKARQRCTLPLGVISEWRLFRQVMVDRVNRGTDQIHGCCPVCP